MQIYKINFNIHYQQWSQIFLSVSKPTLTQSWNYGEAKVKAQNWKVLRGIITENEKPIALIQAWYKNFLFFKLVRVSYGPLWIIDHPSLEQIKGAFREIKKKWGLKKLSVLSIAPNLENSFDHNKILTELCFYKRKSRAYESGWIDLKQSIVYLRAKLRVNWRNQLCLSEKKGLTFQVSNNIVDFQWLICCFNYFRKKKNFYGHSIELLDALYQESQNNYKTEVMFVSSGNERVAGILLADYGSSCIPLIIWLNDNGRKLNAGNFLLWNSVLYAKSKGCLWFDLGSTYNNTFKTGLPHIPFQLIGEYYGL